MSQSRAKAQELYFIHKFRFNESSFRSHFVRAQLSSHRIFQISRKFELCAFFSKPSSLFDLKDLVLYFPRILNFILCAASIILRSFIFLAFVLSFLVIHFDSTDYNLVGYWTRLNVGHRAVLMRYTICLFGKDHLLAFG